MTEGTRIADSWGVTPGSRRRPLIIAHRGDVETAPENTLEAITSAFAGGADGVEVDARLSKDGQVVLLHDRKVDRTTNGIGAVGSFTLEELKDLDAGSWFDPRFSKSTIPTLAEVLEQLPASFLVNVELKVRGWGVMDLVSAVVEVVRRFERWDTTLAASFNPMALLAIRRQEPRIRRGYIWSARHPYPISRRWLSPVAGSHWANPDLRTFTPQVLDHFHRQGKPVLAWDSDAGRDLKVLGEMGLDGLVTDRLTGLVER